MSSGWGWGELWKALGVLDFWVKIVSLGRRFVDVAGTDFLGFGWGGCWHVKTDFFLAGTDFFLWFDGLGNLFLTFC